MNQPLEEGVTTGRRRPELELLGPALVDRVVAEAMEILEKVGVFVEHEAALSLLGDSGARVDPTAGKAFIPGPLIERCLALAPASVTLFDREGKSALRLEGMRVHFNPGSAALKILDSDTGSARRPRTADLVATARLTDALSSLAAQSTAIVPEDVPASVADRYRLYVALRHSTKPIVTGTFTTDGFAVMRDMLAALRGGEAELRRRPLAIFDACSSQPLKWSRLTTDSLLECARAGIPAELISVPMLGATAPVTLAGALVQHTAENLSGLVIHQLAGAGSPIIYGGSPAVLDLRYGTIAMGAIETMMLVAGYAQIGRHLKLPTHGYLGLSDAKVPDAQAGLESGVGAVLAALSGVNVVSGAGMLEFENCQSLEKLVIDDEACGMALRLVRGIEERGVRLAEDLYRDDVADGQRFLTSPLTLRWMREEIRTPGSVIDRRPREAWEASGAKEAHQAARERVLDLLRSHRAAPLPGDCESQLRAIMAADAQRHGMDRLPD